MTAPDLTEEQMLVEVIEILGDLDATVATGSKFLGGYELYITTGWRTLTIGKDTRRELVQAARDLMADMRDEEAAGDA